MIALVALGLGAVVGAAWLALVAMASSGAAADQPLLF